MTNLLFICSRNQWRSPTAEAVWRKHPAIKVRSAGTSPQARRTVNQADIRWADVIFAMEQKHRSRLKAEFTRLLDHKPIHVLEIPDDYPYMDPELVAMLKDSVGAYLALEELREAELPAHAKAGQSANRFLGNSTDITE